MCIRRWGGGGGGGGGGGEIFDNKFMYNKYCVLMSVV